MFAVPWGKVVDILDFRRGGGEGWGGGEKQKLVGLSAERLG